MYLYCKKVKVMERENDEQLLSFLKDIEMESVRFPGDLVRWILSYLNDRTQRVIFKYSFSSLIRFTSGVPQRNHLGLLLFTLFINNLPLVLTK